MPSYFDPRVERWRDEVTGRYTKAPATEYQPPIFEELDEDEEFTQMYRITAGINGVFHKEYFSCMVWSYSLGYPEERDIQDVADRCVKLLYRERLMKSNCVPWYGTKPNISVMPIPFDLELLNTYEEDVEWSR